MKIWRSYGSGHSARLTVVGEFTTVEDASLIEQVVEDFVNAEWEGRYPDVRAFIKAWSSRLRGVEMLGPNQSEFQMGIDNSADVARSGTRVEVSRIRTAEIGGIIKLMLMKDPTEIKVTGKQAHESPI
ncbi:MAG TPA: DUF6375 family protein [Methylomirabilota bacterium]|nr:DUF6375 family protein [Methylomirabilota bacterium]